MSFQYLYAAKFLFDAGTAVYQHNLDLQQNNIQRQNAYKQVAINNNLAYNAQLHINEEDALDLKAHGFDQQALKESIRREKAKQAAIEASLGGGQGRSGQTVEAAALNIERHGFKALARKDLNREIRMRSFERRRTNVNLDAASKNNQLISGLQVDPSLTGLGLQIAGSALQTNIASKQGTSRGFDRRVSD